MRYAILFVALLGCQEAKPKPEPEKVKPDPVIPENKAKKEPEQKRKAPEPTLQIEPEKPKVYTRKEFEKAVTGLSKKELRALLGGPDGSAAPLNQPRVVSEPGSEGYWFYEKRTINPETDKPDKFVYVWIKNDSVYLITY
jgi:hypothetical protein